ncbi:zinc dependent phospholipase C family protein [Faecalibacillus faecis]|uniref:zinc dependent phospholipase C family protein n=1 Tax=Faecalibacillus faecis TaxID=1982628 RepID=UPI002962416D|nr:zinc dependent phospholipase C family protein [Faecalibacillus faecis]
MKKMPSTYAHYRFGQEVLKELPNDIKKIIIKNKERYDIGLHGPDLLFYYLPLKTNEINSIGYNMHEKTGKEVFDTFRKMMTSKKQINHYLAYYYGFICHFALDATCHGYIEKRIHESGVSHGEIEVEFDRFLMIEDGLNPISHHLTNHLVACEENPKCIESTKKLNELYHIGKERALQLLTENNTNNDLYHYTFSGKEEKMRFKMTKEEKNWVLYDVGNSAFVLLVSTIMPIYFNYLSEKAGLSSIDYLAFWGYAASIVTIIVAFLGPVLGTLADTKGYKNPSL